MNKLNKVYEKKKDLIERAKEVLPREVLDSWESFVIGCSTKELEHLDVTFNIAAIIKGFIDDYMLKTGLSGGKIPDSMTGEQIVDFGLSDLKHRILKLLQREKV